MINEMYASITCSCGESFQVLQPADEEGVIHDWDETATATQYHEHIKTCSYCK